MAKYEITFVYDKENKALPKKLETHVKEVGANVEKKEQWGIKSLAYPLKKRTKATYLHIVAEMEPQAVKLLENKLKLEEELLRYLVVKL